MMKQLSYHKAAIHKTLVKSLVFHGFPMVFLQFSHGFWWPRAATKHAWWHQKAFHAICDGLGDGINLASVGSPFLQCF